MHGRLIQALLGTALGVALWAMVVPPAAALVWIGVGQTAGTPVGGCVTVDEDTSETFSVDAGTGAGRKLLVWVIVRGTSDSCPGSGGTRPSATYNGTSMSVLHATADWVTTTNSSNLRICTQALYLDNPASGTNNLAVTVGGGTGSPIAWVVLAAVALNRATGVASSGDDTDGTGGSAATNTGSGLANLTLDSGAEMWASVGIRANDATLADPNSGEVEVVKIQCADASFPITALLTKESYPSGGTDAAYFSWTTSAGFSGTEFELIQ